MRMIPLSLAALFVAGAAFAQQTPAGFGDSVRNNIVVQAGDMNPPYRGDAIEGGNGKRSAEAVRRYEDGKIKAPRGTTASGAQILQGGGSGPAPKGP
jgi:hypothetical protein